MLGVWALLALVGVGGLATELGQQPIGDALNPFPDYGHQELGIDPLAEPGVSAIVIPLFTEVTSTTEAEHASIHIVIKNDAESPKIAFDLAKARSNEIENLIQSISRNSSIIKHHSSSPHRGGGHDLAPALSDDDASDDQPAHAVARIDAKFTNLKTLRRFAFEIQDTSYEDVSIRSLSWSLTRDAQFDALHKLRYQAMRELHVAVKEYVKVYDVDIVGVEGYSDHFRMLGAFDGESEVRLDFNDEDKIREFFAEDPDVETETKVGAVRIVLNAECKFLAHKQ